MIEKIITHGLSTAAVAALDVAIKLGLDYGGWCQTKDAAADRYHLDRIPDASDQMLIEKAIGTADGSLFFVYGGRSSVDLEQSQQTARQRSKPLLVLDLDQEHGFSASRRIAVWIAENRIRVLHVGGEKQASQLAATLNIVASILEATFFMAMMETGVTSPLQSIVQRERFPQPISAPPQSMVGAIDHLERALSLKDKTTIANMAPGELVSLHFTLGNYINTHFDLFTSNVQLLDDCRRCSGQNGLAPKDAAAVIIKQLWERLRDTYRIRIIK